MRKGLATSVILLIFSLLLSAGSLSNVYAQKVKGELEIKKRLATPYQRYVASELAGKVLRNISDARAYIDKKEYAKAEMEVANAQTLIRMIRDRLPTTTIKEQISATRTDMEYEDIVKLKPNFVPIYVSLENIEEYVPVEKTKKHLKKAEKHMEKSEKEKAKKELALAESSLVYREIDLPLDKTEQQLSAAMTSLRNYQFDAADRSLAEAQKVVRFVSVVEFHPLTLAKIALWRSLEAYDNNNFPEAAEQYKLARHYIKEAEEYVDSGKKQELKTLRETMKSTEKFITTSNKRQAARMKGFWKKTYDTLLSMF